ncbi:MAG: 5-formyltetrahydrofolate cyclo-ligase [Deltaproteobacteria bacterium]|jgi:5-formyltetrahydrofolate cyclo-ligase|nr:5-formyltetrahydrofolate cyclo-ligase [Deltaproteobacteria bacterium]
MNEIKNTKNSNLSTVAERLDKFTKEELAQKHEIIESRLFEFANFMESQMVFLYTPVNGEISTENIIKKALQIEKQLVLPALTTTKNVISLYKITNYNKDLVTGVNDILEPDIKKCKKIPLEDIDIAIIPGLAFDDKGGRVGFGNNYYRRLISKLPETCRKISLAYEEQVVDQIQMESRKYTVDIIITDKRIIYKI